MKIRKGIVLLVVNNKGEILILKQKRNKTHSFISGGIKAGESLEDAVIREAYEEVGLQLSSEKLFKTDKTIEFKGSRKGRAKQQVFMYKLDEKPQLNPDGHEISDYIWCKKPEAIELLMNKPPLIKIIKDLL